MRRFNERGEIINENEATSHQTAVTPSHHQENEVIRNEPRRVGNQQTQNPLVFIVIVIGILFAIIFITNANSNQGINSTSNYPVPAYTSDQNNSAAPQEVESSAPQDYSVTTIVEATEYSELTAAYSCSGATPFPPKVSVGDAIYVCTQSDNLIVRKQAEQGGKELFRIPPGTELQIIDGPVCANNNTWWRVELAAGTLVRKGAYNAPLYSLSGDTYGWVREGGDTTDIAFICRK